MAPSEQLRELAAQLAQSQSLRDLGASFRGAGGDLGASFLAELPPRSLGGCVAGELPPPRRVPSKGRAPRAPQRRATLRRVSPLDELPRADPGSPGQWATATATATAGCGYGGVAPDLKRTGQLVAAACAVTPTGGPVRPPSASRGFMAPGYGAPTQGRLAASRRPSRPTSALRHPSRPDTAPSPEQQEAGAAAAAQELGPAVKAVLSTGARSLASIPPARSKERIAIRRPLWSGVEDEVLEDAALSHKVSHLRVRTKLAALDSSEETRQWLEANRAQWRRPGSAHRTGLAKQELKKLQASMHRSQRNMLVADLDGVRRFVAREEHEPSAREVLTTVKAALDSAAGEAKGRVRRAPKASC